MRVSIYFITLIVCAVCIFAASVEILPGLVSFDFIPPGYAFNMRAKAGVPILIPNNNEVAIKWRVFLSASKDTFSLLPGYTNFPDLSWCTVDPPEVVVDAYDTGEVNLIINIPDDPKYYNQYWELGVVVEGSQAVGYKAAGITLGIIPSVMGSYLISTTPKEGLNPAKGTGVAPSAVWLTLNEAIKGKEVKFRIYNNTDAAHEYVIEPYKFPHFEWYEMALAIQLLPNHEEGDLSWINVKKGFLFFKSNKVKIEPGKFADWSVKVKIPDTKRVREVAGWDFAIKVLQDGGRTNSGLFRISVENK